MVGDGSWQFPNLISPPDMGACVFSLANPKSRSHVGLRVLVLTTRPYCALAGRGAASRTRRWRSCRRRAARRRVRRPPGRKPLEAEVVAPSKHQKERGSELPFGKLIFFFFFFFFSLSLSLSLSHFSVFEFGGFFNVGKPQETRVLGCSLPS